MFLASGYITSLWIALQFARNTHVPYFLFSLVTGLGPPLDSLFRQTVSELRMKISEEMAPDRLGRYLPWTQKLWQTVHQRRWWTLGRKNCASQDNCLIYYLRAIIESVITPLPSLVVT